MKTNNQIILKKKKGQWWNIAANKPFSGFASVIDKAKQTDAFNIELYEVLPQQR